MVVSLEQLDRVLRILDTFANTLEREKFRFQMDKDKKILEAQKDGEGIRFSVREGYKRRMLSTAELKANLVACIRNDRGMLMPSALAGFRLMTKSNVVGCSIGKSPGFAPFRILSTNVAIFRQGSL